MVAIQIRTVAAVGGIAVVVAGMSGCSSSGQSASSSSAAPAMTGPAMTGPAMTGPAMTGSAAADPATALVGSGCAGSVSGMAQVPVVTAASNNPDLTTLTAALSGKLNPGVNLVDTLNGGEFTVIAPTDDAFKKLGAATLDRLKTDAPLLTSILTYHVIPGQLSPPLVAGTHKSVQGADVTITGAGEGLKFGGSGLVCGGIQTANATVYTVDTVMMPPAK
jgi:uncharacterized surface protein with fasciclin (FAS1) repeats